MLWNVHKLLIYRSRLREILLNVNTTSVFVFPTHELTKARPIVMTIFNTKVLDNCSENFTDLVTFAKCFTFCLHPDSRGPPTISIRRPLLCN